MAERMTAEKWEAMLRALRRGIDEMTFDLENEHPDDRPRYGSLERNIEKAEEAFRILRARHNA